MKTTEQEYTIQQFTGSSGRYLVKKSSKADGTCRIIAIFDRDGTEQERAFILTACNSRAELISALKAAELELEANKQAMLGPEWAAQRTLTGGALLQVSRAILRAEGKL